MEELKQYPEWVHAATIIKEKMNEDIRRGAIPQAPEPENFMNMMDEKESE